MAESIDQKTSLAQQRTLLASERTLMAWIRTSVSMSGFGFTIYKFFQYLVEGGVAHTSTHGPRIVGLALIGFGIFSLVTGIFEFISVHKLVLPHEKVWAPLRFASVIFAVLLGIIEIALFITLLRDTRF